jgi:hypothetical protein
MKFRRTAVAALAALVVAAAVPTAAFAEYEKDAVVTVMRNNVVQLAAARDAAGKADFLSAGVALADIARSMHSIKRFVPNKGDKAQWDKTIESLVLAALKGAGAAAANDKQGLDASLADLRRFMAAGHASFR